MKERQVPDGRHAVIDDDFLDILFLTIPLYTIIHRAGAGDGQGAVTIQCPGQVIAADASYGEVGDEIAVGGGGEGVGSANRIPVRTRNHAAVLGPVYKGIAAVGHGGCGDGGT